VGLHSLQEFQPDLDDVFTELVARRRANNGNGNGTGNGSGQHAA
jgi:hypothetical protein